MEPGLQVKVLLILAAVLLLSAFGMSWRAGAKFKQLTRWIEATHPEEWNALPWSLRKIGRGAAVERLRHGAVGEEPEFVKGYKAYKDMNRWMAILTFVGAVPLGLVILGTQFWGWAW